MQNLTFIIILNCQFGFVQWINHGKSKNLIKPGRDMQIFIDKVGENNPLMFHVWYFSFYICDEFHES